MSIDIAQGFNIVSKEPIDDRLVLTKTQMKNLLKGQMPDNYLCICKDDGKLYLWNSSFERDSEIGRFKPYEDILDLPKAIKDSIEKSPEAKKQMAESISIALPGAIKVALEKQADQDSGLYVDENGNIKVGVNKDQMDIIDNKISIAIGVIQAIDGNI